MEQRITVTARNVYGTTKLYPANSQAHALAEIAGTKTLSVAVLQIAARMGFLVTVAGDTTEAAILQATIAEASRVVTCADGCRNTLS